MLLLVLSCLLASPPAFAGAWLRDKGSWFSSTSSIWARDGSFYNNYFAEYGLWDRMTIGVDAGFASDGQVSALFFSRVPLWHSDKGHRIALEVGGGHSAGRPVSKTSLSYGRGFSLPQGNGWLAIDAAATIDLWTGFASYQVDSTVGLAPSDNWKAIVKMHSVRSPGVHPTLKIAPSVVRRLGKHTQLEIGLSETVLGGRRSQLKLGIWLEF